MLVGRIVALRRAERRDLDRLRTDVHVHEAEPAADDERAAEERLDLLRLGVGREVEVLGFDPEEQIAHGAADDVRLEACVLQLARHLERAARELAAAERVVGGPVHARLARPAARRASGGRAGGGSSRGGRPDSGRGGASRRENRRATSRESAARAVG